LFINITLLFLSPICLADGEISLNLNTGPKDKEMINNLPEDSVIRKTCEQAGISLSDAISKHEMHIKVAKRVQTEAHSLSLLDEIRSWELEDFKNEPVGSPTTEQPESINTVLTLEDLPTPAKFALGVTTFGLSGGSLSRNLASYSMQPPLSGGISACKLPFIVKPVPLPIMGRLGATAGVSIFIGGVCTGCINLDAFDCSGALALLNK